MLAITNRTNNPSQFELRWPSKAGQQFELQSTTNASGAFETVSNGLEATQPANNWWGNRDATGHRLFRLWTKGSPARPANIVTNGDFSSALTKWSTSIGGSAIATFAMTNSEVVATIGTNAGTPSQIQLIQTGIALTNGRTYMLRFDARAFPLSRAIDARLTSTNSSPRTNYLQQDSIAIDSVMKTYTTTFTMTNGTDPFARVAFNFGADTNNVVIDNVQLFEGEWFNERAAAHELNRRLDAGNNFMAAWAIADKAAPEDVKLLNNSGFSHCRIGYKMDELDGASPNFTIPAAEMQRLENIVEYCLAEGIIAIVDPVHNWSNGPGYAANDLPELVKIWQQVATNFASYPADMVVFEILNEPHTGSNISNITATILSTIRAVPGNSNRLVIVSGEGFSTRQALINAFDNDWIPANDPYLIGTFHYYDPRAFTKQGDLAFNPTQTNVTWGTSTEIAQMDADFAEVTAANQAWALRHATEKLPIYLGEFGADNLAPAADRKRWLARVRMGAQKLGFSHAHWAMYNNAPDSKGMGPWTTTQVNNPATRTFDADPLEALMTKYQAESQTFSGDVTNSSALPGYTGTGYASFPATTGPSVYCQINGYIPATDTYVVAIRYASANNVTLSLNSLNDSGATVQTKSVSFPSTGSFNNWGLLKTTMSFQAGENARLQIIADTVSGPIVDYVRFTR